MPQWLIGIVGGIAAAGIVILLTILVLEFTLRRELKRHYHERED